MSGIGWVYNNNKPQNKGSLELATLCTPHHLLLAVGLIFILDMNDFLFMDLSFIGLELQTK
ncbi:hypothetical protein ACVCEA_07725 [Escherichia coli]